VNGHCCGTQAKTVFKYIPDFWRRDNDALLTIIFLMAADAETEAHEVVPASWGLGSSTKEVWSGN